MDSINVVLRQVQKPTAGNGPWSQSLKCWDGFLASALASGVTLGKGLNLPILILSFLTVKTPPHGAVVRIKMCKCVQSVKCM